MPVRVGPEVQALPRPVVGIVTWKRTVGRVDLGTNVGIMYAHGESMTAEQRDRRWNFRVKALMDEAASVHALPPLLDEARGPDQNETTSA